jgi:alpha-ketoglutarate-dependent taurine dioxygenase
MTGATVLERPTRLSQVQDLTRDGLVRADVRPGGVPLVVRPANPKLAEDQEAFFSWFAGAKVLFDHLAAVHGAIMFRGFPLHDTPDFNRAMTHYPPGSRSYIGGNVYRDALAERVFEATKARKEYPLIPHQEMAYMPRSPRMIAFWCKTAPWAGGETTVSDYRRMREMLPSRIWDKVKACGVRYERNFRSPESQVSELRALLHKDWPSAFESDDPKQAEETCRAVGLEPRWEADGSLTTIYTAPGIVEHPLTGETVWFNHIGPQNYYKKGLGPERWKALIEEAPPGMRTPNNTLYGDGTEISQEDLEEVFIAFDLLGQAIRWADGDLLLIDNVMTAHGRNPFEGARDVQVSLLG